ncbi:hypothetical protein ABGT15_13865 [Flavobacterium enshiense]|uniref:hypothetical protein n=1 Tax=Flavobacterium enshiense TaxID=1341165 RepID=UPI00345DE86D
MKKVLLLLMLVPLITATQCAKEATFGLNVAVHDAVSNKILTEGVVVVATEGDYSEQLEDFGGNGAFSGAIEREGIYVLRVSKLGYQTYTSKAIKVETDGSQVIPKNIIVRLMPK